MVMSLQHDKRSLFTGVMVIMTMIHDADGESDRISSLCWIGVDMSGIQGCRLQGSSLQLERKLCSELAWIKLSGCRV